MSATHAKQLGSRAKVAIGLGTGLGIALLAFIIWLAAISSSCSREMYRWDAEFGHGVEREVTLYSADGDEIGRWEGIIDVEYTDGRADLVFFDEEGNPIDRVVITPGVGSLVVDQK